MRTKNFMVVVSDKQIEKLDEVVKYHGSDRAKIIRRGFYLLNDLKISKFRFVDHDYKKHSIQVRLTEEDAELVSKLEDRFDKKYTDISRFIIDLQYAAIEELKKHERQIIKEHLKNGK